MGNRLSKIYTRTGDAGTTGLADGSRLAKDAPRIEAIGAVDELNSSVGVLLAERLPRDVRGCLTDVQHDLFDLGGELSVPGHAIMSAGAHPAAGDLARPLQRETAAAQGFRAAGRDARGGLRPRRSRRVPAGGTPRRALSRRRTRRPPTR